MLINDIRQGLKAAFTAQLAAYKKNNTAVKDQLIWDGAESRDVKAETWYRWVNTNISWGLPKIQTGTLAKSPIDKSLIAAALTQYATTLQEQRSKVTGFEFGSDDTQYLYLNVVDGNDKVKVIELKLGIRPQLAVQQASIYHFDDEADETVLEQYQDALKFEGQKTTATVAVKRLKKSDGGLVKDVVNLQVALLNQKAIGFENEAYVASVVKVEEQQRNPSPTTSTEEQAKVIQPETAGAAVVMQAEEQADANISTTTSTEEPQPDAMVKPTEEHAKELQEQANQAAKADEERFNRETAAKTRAIADAQAAYDAVLAKHTEAETSIKNTAAALAKAVEEYNKVEQQHTAWKAKPAPTRLQHFSAQNRMQVRLLKAITLTLCVGAIITIAALKISDAKLILGIFTAALLIPGIMFLPFLSFKKPAPVSTVNPFENALNHAMNSKKSAENALIKKNAFEASLAEAINTLDLANAITVASLSVSPLEEVSKSVGKHPLEGMKHQSSYNFDKASDRKRTNSNASNDSGNSAQSASSTAKPVVYIRKVATVIANPKHSFFNPVNFTEEELDDLSIKFSDDELKALLADNADEAKNMQLRRLADMKV